MQNFKYAKVKICKHLFSEFKMNIGLRQGDVVAGLLFNMVLEIAHRRSKVNTWGTMFDKCCQIMVYADITGRRLQDVKEAFTTLFEQKNMGLEVEKKYKI
jgi:hypothetical protein